MMAAKTKRRRRSSPAAKRKGATVNKRHVAVRTPAVTNDALAAHSMAVPATTHDVYATGEDEAQFLADVQHVLLRLCCYTLPRMTVATSPACLASYNDDDDDDENDGAGDRARATASSSSSSTSALHEHSRALRTSAHEDIYRTVLHTIAASCALGHRSCQALWGARGCGKHRVLRRVAHACAQQRNTLVLQLDGSQLRGEAVALRVIARQLGEFLCAPQSAALRATSWPVRSGTLDFCQLYHLDQHVASPSRDDASQHDDESGDDDRVSTRYNNNDDDDTAMPVYATWGNCGDENDKDMHDDDDACSKRERRRCGAKAQRGDAAASTRQRRQPPHSTALRDGDGDSDSDRSAKQHAIDVAAATTSAVDADVGAASALTALKHALLHMRSMHTHLVLCIRHVDVFAVWCDQLLYVLAGLMHDGDGNGGGVSLLLTSPSPDLRHVEKRLSSRLTCETRHVPLLPWTMRGVVSAVLTRVRDECAAVVAQHNNSNSNKKQSSATAQWVSEVCSLLSGWRFTAAATTTTTTVSDKDGDDGVHAVPRLYTHPTLFVEAVVTMCDALLHSLQAVEHDDAGDDSDKACATAIAADNQHGSVGDDNDNNSSRRAMRTTVCLATMVQQSDAALTDSGATAEAVLTASTRLLCRAASGAVDVLADDARAHVRAWLRARYAAAAHATHDEGKSSTTAQRQQSQRRQQQQRQRQQTQQHDASDDACARAVFAPLRAVARSAAVCTQWRDAHAATSTAAAATSSATTANAATTLPVMLADDVDLLDGGRMLHYGYGARESFLLLVQMLQHHDANIAARSAADLLVDVSSAMGTRAAAALDHAAYRHALSLLCRWRLLSATSRQGDSVALCGAAARVRECVHDVLQRRNDWCVDELGLEAKEWLRIRNTT